MSHSEGEKTSKMSPLYATKVAVNAFSSFVYLACGIALIVVSNVALAPLEGTIKLNLGSYSVGLCGGVLLLFTFMPILTLLNWVNMHKDCHEPTARQAR